MSFEYLDLQKNLRYGYDCKDNRIVAYFTQDELNAWIGVDFINRKRIYRKDAKTAIERDKFDRARQECLSR